MSGAAPTLDDGTRPLTLRENDTRTEFLSMDNRRRGSRREEQRERTKIFGIGLNKTGTRSVARALRILGFRVMHKGDEATSALVERARLGGEPLLKYIGEKYDAYFDVAALVRNFALLDAQYPNSRFILTVRDVDEWLDSRERHVAANQEAARRGLYTGTFLDIDRERWREEWWRHCRDVEQYFDGRENLLVYRVDDGWEPLASFLGHRKPSMAFPWENRQGRGTYKGEPLAPNLRRRAEALWYRIVR